MKDMKIETPEEEASMANVEEYEKYLLTKGLEYSTEVEQPLRLRLDLIIGLKHLLDCEMSKELRTVADAKILELVKGITLEEAE